MAYYVINGGKRLEGSVTISGAKNAALAIIPACILAGESCRLENLPRIEDVHVLEQILRMMGAGVDVEYHVFPGCYHCFELSVPDAEPSKAAYEMMYAALRRAFRLE